MKVGLVGYDKPEIESALQAYAIKEFLLNYNVSCGYTKNWETDNENELVLKQFIEEHIGFSKEETISHFLMINYKSMVDMSGSTAAYCDYYQYSFSAKDKITEALFLCDLKQYEKITKLYNSTNQYVFVDCFSSSSALLSNAQKIAKSNKINLISLIQDRKSDKTKSDMIYDPQEYLGIIRGAKFIITDSFMTIWFAILNRIPFIAQDNPSLPGKNKQFLKYLDLMKHYRLKEINDINGYNIKHEKKLEQSMLELKKTAVDNLLSCLPPVFLDSIVNAPPQILKSECCGCYTCKEVCPVSAITMKQDEEGFYYPHVDDKCIDCGLCAKRCVKKENQQLVKYENQYPKVICALNEDETVRLKSSSGGVFPAFAKYIIEEQKGVVFGVKFDENMDAVSSMASTMEEVEKFYGSKYVKSEIDGIYKKVKEQLNAGKKVLYSGLPCECAGLRAFLNKEYDNLFICEILCHAVPSPRVFKDYIKYINKKFHGTVSNVRFREKSKGWLSHQNSLVFEFKDKKPLVVNARCNNYYRNFSLDYIARMSCTKCSFTKLNRVGDITIGDFWGINKLDEDMFDNKGVSGIILNNEKGAKLWGEVSDQFKHKEKTIAQFYKYNHSKPIHLKSERISLFQKLGDMPINDLLAKYNDLKK